ncbi:cell division protein FtsQ/DivIB [Candidatus Berkelbacteria bacterium]|nr:cell division protein FtsQ/DivIB [Candidatus Berkelbacteria bacterium]
MRQTWRKKYGVGRQHKYLHPKIYSKTRANKPKKKIIIPKFVWLALVVVSFIGGLSWFVFGSDYFLVKEIRVVGSITPEVEAAIDGLHGEHLLTYSTVGMTKNLKKTQGSIRRLEISKGLPSTLLIDVVLRKPVLIWRTNGKDYLIDKDGVIYNADVDELKSNHNLPLIEDTMKQPVAVGSPIVTKPFVEFITELNDQFSDSFPISITKFVVRETTFEVELHTDKGWYVLFDTNRLVKPQLDGLKDVFEKFGLEIKEYVDLRIEGKAYFK